jgi:cyclopropane fatty-acyl-phospholipid synthase-like methyltransferase
MWNERYSEPGYLFGTEPATFLSREAGRLLPGQTALCVADGEGRNSVFLAERGLQVTAMDASDVAVDKARALADTRSVTVDFHVADIATWDWTMRQHDVVAGIFFQFAGPALRDEIFAGMVHALAPGGLILLHGYTPAQLKFNTGGPRVLENLYTSDLLADRFKNLEILHLAEYEADLSEGSRHVGRSALIDLVARRRA